MRFFLFICPLMFLLSCQSPADKMECALNNGELSRVEALLADMSGREMYSYASRLIDEYLAIGNVDKAIYVFNYLTPHCSMYEISSPVCTLRHRTLRIMQRKFTMPCLTRSVTMSAGVFIR
jgi:hypothetical protein